MSKLIDLTGCRFGRWTVLEFDRKQKRQYLWKCRCDCGTIAIVDGKNIRDGNSRSCGCLRREMNESRRGKKMGKYKKRFRPLHLDYYNKND